MVDYDVLEHLLPELAEDNAVETAVGILLDGLHVRSLGVEDGELAGGVEVDFDDFVFWEVEGEVVVDVGADCRRGVVIAQSD